MRLILPEQVPVKFPDIIITPPEIPPQRPPQLPPPEEPIPEEPNPLPPQNPVGPIQPPMGAPGGGTTVLPWRIPKSLRDWMRQATLAFEDLKRYVATLVFEDGSYIEYESPAGEKKKFSLKTEKDDEEFICTFGTDKIVGKEFKELLDDHGSEILEIVRDENSGIPANTITVITGVSLTASGLEFKQRTLSVIEAGAEGAGPTISVVECDAAAGGNP